MFLPPVCLAKVERGIQDLFGFLERHNILSNSQLGFRSGKSTIEAVTHLVEFDTVSLNIHNQMLSVFLDLKSNRLCHSQYPVAEAWRYGVCGPPHQWLQSYFSDYIQFKQVKNTVSSSIKLYHGISEGSILGPAVLNTLTAVAKIIIYTRT